MTVPATRQGASASAVTEAAGPARATSASEASPDGEANPDAADAVASPSALAIARTVLKALPVATVLTSLLFYFGWARSAQEARYFGIDDTALGMSVSDYVLRSVDSLYLPGTMAVAFGLVALLVHDRVLRRIDEGRTGAVARGARGLSVAWLVLPALALAGERVLPGSSQLTFPLACTVGIALAVYARHLRRLLGISAKGRYDGVLTALVGALLVLTTFWTVSAFAEVVGRGHGRQIAGNLALLTRVALYSPTDLHLDAPGVAVDRLAGADTDDKGRPVITYRYTGLRMLQYSGGRYFLLSDGWTRTHGAVIVIPDDAHLRFAFLRGPVGAG